MNDAKKPRLDNGPGNVIDGAHGRDLEKNPNKFLNLVDEDSDTDVVPVAKPLCLSINREPNRLKEHEHEQNQQLSNGAVKAVFKKEPNEGAPAKPRKDSVEQAAQPNENEEMAQIENMSKLTFLTLNEDCTSEIFNWLSSGDVKSIGQTCKKLRQLTADHFKLKYPAKKLKVRTPLSYDRPASATRDPNGFAQYYRNVFIEDADIEIFHFLAKNCTKLLNKIQFGQKLARKKISRGFGVIVKDHLKDVSSIEFLGCRIDGELHHLILKFCENLKSLSIRIYADEGDFIGDDDNWLLEKYYALEHLALVKGASKIPQLEKFFDRNQKIKSFTTTAPILQLHRKVLERDSVNLNDFGIELSLSDKDRLKQCRRILNHLHGLGRFKRLNLRLIDASILIDYSDVFESMHRLGGIYFDCDVVINEEFFVALATLSELKTIYVRRPIIDCKTETTTLLQGALNVEEMFIQTIKNDDFSTQILPLIQKSPKLRTIFIRKVDGELNLKLIQINNERVKLRDAKKITLYLDDNTYLHIKWKEENMKFSAIEIKRTESQLFDHPFALHDE